MTGGEKRQQTEALMIVRYALASSDLMINDINSGKLSVGSYAVKLDEYGTVVPKVLAEYRFAQPAIRDKHGVAPQKGETVKAAASPLCDAAALTRNSSEPIVVSTVL